MVLGSRAMSESGYVGRPVALLMEYTGLCGMSLPGSRERICPMTGLMLQQSTWSILTLLQFSEREKLLSCSERCVGKKCVFLDSH